MGQELFPHFDITTFLSQLSSESGVYQMLSDSDKILYVGKAKNLKNRLQSYKHTQNPRLKALLEKVHQIIVTVTHTEQQALTLESQLIKSHQPPYNVLLKDHKSALYLTIEKGHAFPRLTMTRSQKNLPGGLGPFPSRELAQKTADQLFKIFQLRSCSDHTFASRTRPCLQYQIKQCSAPCVGYISKEQYRQSLDEALSSMKHASNGLFEILQEKMLAFSAAMEYEKAQATFEHIGLLRSLQRQHHDRAPEQRLDILALEGHFAQHVIIAGGLVQSSRFLNVLNPLDETQEILFEQLLQRCYDDLPVSWVPPILLMRAPPFNNVLIQDRKVVLRDAKNSTEEQWLTLAHKSLWANSRKEHKSASFWLKRFHELKTLLGLETLEVIDTVDISHHQGSLALGGVIRCGLNGFSKADYRYYYLDGAQGRHDDLESIEETVYRHLKRCLQRGAMPDLMLIDGGKNQLARAYQGWLNAQCPPVSFISIAKAPGRRSGEETVYYLTGKPLTTQQVTLGSQSEAAFLLMQHMRDEAHRFVISRQRQRQRHKALQHPFDGCTFLSPELKKKLLTEFGGWQGLRQARYEQLLAYKGIGPRKAASLLEYFEIFR